MDERLRIFPNRVAEQGFKPKAYSASCKNETLVQQMLTGYRQADFKRVFWKDFFESNVAEFSSNKTASLEAFFVRLGERTSWLTPYTRLHSGNLQVITSSYFSALKQSPLPFKVVKRDLASANKMIKDLFKENPGIMPPKPKGRAAYLAQRLAYEKTNEVLKGEIKRYPYIAGIIVRTVGEAAASLEKGVKNSPAIHLMDFIDLGLLPVGIVEREVGVWAKRKKPEFLIVEPQREKAA